MHAGLGGRVAQSTGAAAAALGGDRTQVDDATARFTQMRQHRQRKQKGTFQVSVDHRVPFLLGLRQGRIGGNHPGKTGVVDQHIQSAQIGGQLGGHFFHRATLAQVSRIMAGAVANLLRRLLQALRVTRHDGDAVILLCQLLGDGQSNTAGSAGNHRCTLRHS